MIITIRTDKPESEIGLYENLSQQIYLKWHAHLELAESIHEKVLGLIKTTGKNWHDIKGVVVYSGPGSFTGLRIGISFANTIAYSLEIPIVGSSGEAWIESGIKKILKNQNEKVVIPEYGGRVHITLPKK